MNYENIYIEEEGAIATITIDRPKKLNASMRNPPYTRKSKSSAAQYPKEKKELFIGKGGLNF